MDSPNVSLYTDIGHDWDKFKGLKKEELWLVDKNWNLHSVEAPADVDEAALFSHSSAFTKAQRMENRATGRFQIDKYGNKKASLSLSPFVEPHQKQYVIKRVSKMLDSYYDNPDIVVFE